MGLLNSIYDTFSSIFFTKEKLAESKREINRDPAKDVLTNRYNSTHYSEAIDPGIYGYSTRSEGIKTFGYPDVERCFRDPKVQSCLDVRVNSVFQSDIHIIPADDTSPEALEMKLFIDEIKKEIKGTVEDEFKEAAKIGLFFGFSIAEIVPKKSETKEFTGKLIIDKIQAKRPGLVEFITDSYDNVLAVHSLVNQELYIEPNRFLIFTSNPMFGNPYGSPLYDTVVSAVHDKWDVKDFAQRYALKYGSGGVPFVEYTNKEDKELALQLANDLYEGCSFAAPTGIIAKFIELGIKGNKDPFIPLMEYYNDQISLGIVGPDLSQGAGSHASDKVKADERGVYTQELKRIMQELFNEQIIRRFCEFNFDKVKYPPSLYPKCEFVQASDGNKTEFIGNVVQGVAIKALNMDNPIHANYVCKNMGWPLMSSTEVKEKLAWLKKQPITSVHQVNQPAKTEKSEETDKAELIPASSNN